MSGEKALDEIRRLEAAISATRALLLSNEARARLDEHLRRARAQVQEAAEPVLIIALAGGTGAGKSTLINALAGAPIAQSGEKRPTTTGLRVYHHQDIGQGGLPATVSKAATHVAHDRPELRLKVLVDTPDLDSYRTEHRDTTRALLQAAGLVLYVFSPENYGDERTWSVLREEKRFSACAAVLNKIDRIGSEDVARIVDDLRSRFAEAGLPYVRLFRVSALAHASGRARTADDMPALRALLERELRDGEIAKMLREQRLRVVEELAEQVERVAPLDALERLTEVEGHASGRLAGLAASMFSALEGRLAAVELELDPLIVLRRHEHFRGPLRSWLAVSDFLRFALPALAARWSGRAARGPEAIRQLLRGAFDVDGLRREAFAIQDRLFAAGLPVQRWKALGGAWGEAEEGAGELSRDLSRELAEELELRFEATAASLTGPQRLMVDVASWLGALAPVGLGLATAGLLIRDLMGLQLAAASLGVNLLVSLLLCFLGLQGLASLAFPLRRGWSREFGRQALESVAARRLGSALRTYRAELAKDLDSLYEPLEALRQAFEAPPALPERPSDARPAIPERASAEPPPEPPPAPPSPPEPLDLQSLLSDEHR